MTDAAPEDPDELVLEERHDHVLVLSPQPTTPPPRPEPRDRGATGAGAAGCRSRRRGAGGCADRQRQKGVLCRCRHAGGLRRRADVGTAFQQAAHRRRGQCLRRSRGHVLPRDRRRERLLLWRWCPLGIGCDIRLASTTATFRLPGAEYGLVVAAAALPRLVGAARAKELIYTTRRFDAAEAHAWGLVSTVHEPDELMPAALEMAAQIAANSPAAVQASKAVIDAATLSDEAEALELDHNRKLRGSPEQSKRFRDATRRVTGR